MKNKYFYSMVTIIQLFVLLSSVYGNGFINIQTDKSRYDPSSYVKLDLVIESYEENLKLIIKYYSLDKIIDEQSLNITSTKTNWEWLAPALDFQGYLVQAILMKNNEIQDQTSIAVDVSSNWTKFPRYGFLSSFNPINPQDISKTISKLNRYHINGLQFYDWQYKHHKPLKGTGENPAISWTDIANRTIYLPTLKNYIDTAHSRNMMTMAYNLIYGAYEDAENEGVSNQWRLFSDANHSNPDFHDLPDSWASDIYLINPANELWQNYLIYETNQEFMALNFDGWHVDQLGDRGTRYDYNGNQVNLPSGFLQILNKAKQELNKSLVMNAVNQYAQTTIAESPVDFLYTEVWAPNSTYEKLAKIILENDAMSNNELKTILAAYINKDLSNLEGEFNSSAVIYANAVIFAFGGSHLELGEHMLCNEYFPNNNLSITPELEKQLINYYDFLVSYQNLLRGNGEIINEQLKTNSDLNFIPWARSFSVWNFARQVENKKVFHLLNFSDANTLDWRDNSGTQTEPNDNVNVPVYYETEKKVYKIWMASPDYLNGIPQKIEFFQENGKVSFQLPKLKYWDMVVIDFDSTTSLSENNVSNLSYQLSQNYPNPFNPNTTIIYSIPNTVFASAHLAETLSRQEAKQSQEMNVTLKVYDILGNEVSTLVNENQKPGIYKINFNARNLASGLYIYKIQAGSFNQVRKMMLLK